jgi:hypothetical protein
MNLNYITVKHRQERRGRDHCAIVQVYGVSGGKRSFAGRKGR